MNFIDEYYLSIRCIGNIDEDNSEIYNLKLNSKCEIYQPHYLCKTYINSYDSQTFKEL